MVRTNHAAEENYNTEEQQRWGNGNINVISS